VRGSFGARWVILPFLLTPNLVVDVTQFGIVVDSEGCVDAGGGAQLLSVRQPGRR
jgi:hypothetical protein